jgi:phosphate transport system substrate-binding protein
MKTPKRRGAFSAIVAAAAAASLSAIMASAAFLVALSLLASPAPAADKSGAATEMKGIVRISGAWALYPMMVKWGEEFMKKYPKVRIDVSAGGAGKGMADALARLVDIGMVSREIRPEETEQGVFSAPVVKDAVFPTLNSQNPVLKSGLLQKGVTKKVFTALWIEGRSMTWGEVAGAGPSGTGAAGAASKQKVSVYTRSDSCGAAETWAQYLGGKQEDLMGVAVYGDPGLADAVKRDAGGTGYNNLNYAYDMKTGNPVEGILIIPIDVNENGKIDPQEDLSTKKKAIVAIQTGAYPSPPARDLYIVTKGGFQGLSKEFVRWILTEGQAFVDETGYIRLEERKVRETLKKIEG